MGPFKRLSGGYFKKKQPLQERGLCYRKCIWQSGFGTQFAVRYSQLKSELRSRT